jgi:hypothetical protein
MKSGRLNLLERWGSVQACTGVALLLADESYTMWQYAISEVEGHAQKRAEHRTFNFHIRTVHRDIIKVVLFTNWCTSDCLKNDIKIYIKIDIK